VLYIQEEMGSYITVFHLLPIASTRGSTLDYQTNSSNRTNTNSLTNIADLILKKEHCIEINDWVLNTLIRDDSRIAKIIFIMSLGLLQWTITYYIKNTFKMHF
jgi:hypothetical protein